MVKEALAGAAPAGGVKSPDALTLLFSRNRTVARTNSMDKSARPALRKPLRFEDGCEDGCEGGCHVGTAARKNLSRSTGS